MPKKKKFSKGTPIALADFFGAHHQPAVDTGHSSDDEQEERQTWNAERDRQKAASRQAEALSQKRAQAAVLLGEEHDHRANLTAIEKTTRTRLEDAISEACVEREWIEFQIAGREEREQKDRAKKAPFNQMATQQMLHRANIADKETERRLSFFNGFAASTNKAKAAEKLAADRKKAADRAKAFEERTRKTSTEKSSLFQLVDAPTGNATEAKTPETTQAGGWLSGWFSRN